MAERWWRWQTSSHHQKQAHICSFLIVEVGEVANKQPPSKTSTCMLVFDSREVVVVANQQWRGQRLPDIEN